ncbi:MAG: Nramp family divalent metal transporter [Pirellulaceae bacterium]|nr:Nramp family divalent metal transporter [Pirellulaceae bacterium]
MTTSTQKNTVPNETIPCGTLPPLEYRDLPAPIALRKMLGPSIILAGLALGSGEFVLWPYVTYKVGFVFFWACILGVTTQYFLNMEITRWSLATGESAITGFVRLSRHWAWVFLLLNVLPWMIPAWAKGAAQIISWMIWGPILDNSGALVGTYYATPLAIGGMIFCGLILTAGPVLYDTIERIQIILVSSVMLLVVIMAVWLVSGRLDAVTSQVTALFTFGAPQFIPPFDADLTPVLLLGALAFAGAGGTTNLGQSNYIKDKGYGMGRYIGRITSPITGQKEAIAEVGYHFPPTDKNLQRWRAWWRAASIEHFLSFFCTCLLCLILLTLISYAIFFDSNGQRIDDAAKFANGIGFVWGEAVLLEDRLGGAAQLISPKFLFLVMGIAILLTTEFGVLDVASRISTDVVKVTWLRENKYWSEGRLYYLFLWGTIFLGSSILLLETLDINVGAFGLFKLSAAMNGCVMFLYSGLLLYINRWRLPEYVRARGWRVAILIWAVGFFGFFACWAGYTTLRQLFS